MRQRGAWILLLALWSTGAIHAADDLRVSTVGMAARIDHIVLPGSELEAIPTADRRVPIVVRVLNVARHGSAYRYDLLYYGLEPGTFDLRQFLRRKDGSSSTELPPIPVTIETLLPAGQIQPHPLETKRSPNLSGYRWALVIGSVVWILGLLAILFLGRRRTRQKEQTANPEPTLADRLLPLVEDGMKGRLSPARCAELERTLLAYWRRRLNLPADHPVETFGALRLHPDAGPLLIQLEKWLHQPTAASEVDVAALLRPYRDLAADALATPERGAHP